jgi:cobalt-precorrin-5B (C1)-methyltransferase
LNARLGIVGGISILGTTGIVRPLSHAAYTATIDSALSVAKACRISRPVLTTGRRSERFAQSLWPEMAPEAFVQIGDYFRHAMAAAADKGFVHVTLAVFFGKALKMAQGVAHTHAAANTLTLDRLAEWTLAVTGDPDLADNIAQANTARYAFDRLKPAHDTVIGQVGAKVVSAAASFAGPGMAVRAVIFGYDGTVAFDSAAVTRTERL